MYIQSMYKQQPTSILTSLFIEDDPPSDIPTLLSTAKQKYRESHIKLKDIINDIDVSTGISIIVKFSCYTS